MALNNLTEVQASLRMAGYYHQYITNFEFPHSVPQQTHQQEPALELDTAYQVKKGQNSQDGISSHCHIHHDIVVFKMQTVNYYH